MVTFPVNEFLESFVSLPWRNKSGQGVSRSPTRKQRLPNTIVFTICNESNDLFCVVDQYPSFLCVPVFDTSHLTDHHVILFLPASLRLYVTNNLRMNEIMRRSTYVTVDLFEGCHMATALRNTGTRSQFVACREESHDPCSLRREVGVVLGSDSQMWE